MLALFAGKDLDENMKKFQGDFIDFRAKPYSLSLPTPYCLTIGARVKYSNVAAYSFATKL